MHTHIYLNSILKSLTFALILSFFTRCLSNQKNYLGNKYRRKTLGKRISSCQIYSKDSPILSG